MAIDYIRSQAATNGNVQLVANLYPAQMPLNIIAGDKVYIYSMSGNYGGIRTVERVIQEGNTAIVQLAATPFKVSDVGIYNKVSTPTVTASNPNPGAATTVSVNPGITASNPAVITKSATLAYTSVTRTVAELKAIIQPRIASIMADAVKLKDIVTNFYGRAKAENTPGRLGFSQTVALKAIAELKQAGIMGATELGTSIGNIDLAWIKANYAFDEYVDPGLTAAQNEARDDFEYKAKIYNRIAEIKANEYRLSFILLALRIGKPAGLGYTQMLAYTAISELKAGTSPSIPINRWGAGQYGHTAWVKANYPFDAYMAPVKVEIPVKPVNPNPAVTPVIPAVTPVISAPLPVFVKGAEVPLLKQPIVRVVLLVVAIIIVIKLISK